MKPKSYLIIAVFIAVLSCNHSEDDPLPSQTISFNFDDGVQEWTAGMSDFPSDWDPEGLEFSFEHSSLPPEVNNNGKALKISGRNISDDLFMFIKREISGLKVNHTYSLFFDIELASQYPAESVGIGGSPGSSVYLKAGGSDNEPQVIDMEGGFQMNIDKGNQSQGGNDMVVLGTVGIPGEDFRYTLINRNNDDQPVRVTTDANGKMWAIVGTDSGFEGTTTLYYNKISIRLQE